MIRARSAIPQLLLPSGTSFRTRRFIVVSNESYYIFLEKKINPILAVKICAG
jgi:hypothetical protein